MSSVTRRICALWLVYAATVHAQAAGRITLEPYPLRTYDGQTHEIEIGRLIVPESRARPAGPTVSVAFLRLKSTSAKPGSPIVFLMGGPGIPATVIAPIPPYWELFDALRASGDVILLDQRGLGLSSPKLDCPPVKDALDTALLTSQAALISAYRHVVAACAAYWRSKGVDPRAYTDAAIADDIDDVRTALGVPRVSILGFSYGTRLAMTFARRHPERLERIVLQGPSDADLEYHISLQHDSLLARMARFAAADSVAAPFSRDLVQRMRALFDRAANQPILLKIRRASGDSVVRRGDSHGAGRDLFSRPVAGKASHGGFIGKSQHLRRVVRQLRRGGSVLRRARWHPSRPASTCAQSAHGSGTVHHRPAR